MNETPASAEQAALVAEECRARRTALGMSASDLAQKAGIARGTLAAIESGQLVRAASIRAVARALDDAERAGSQARGEEVAGKVELPDGTVVTFTGSTDAVRESVKRLLERPDHQ